MEPELDTEVIVIGAGPYGMTAAIQLRRAGTAVHVFGDPMASWRRMPRGMLLRSNRSATNMVAPSGPLSLDQFASETGSTIETPVPLATFIHYGEWIRERELADLDPRFVTRVDRTSDGFTATLADGDAVTAQRVVIAGGIEPFAWVPPEFRSLPASFVSHTSSHPDLSVFAGRDVAVVGGGQSSLESAALLAEAGARVRILARKRQLVWLRGHGIKKRLGAIGPVVYAPTDVGPLWYSRLVAAPTVFRLLPRSIQDGIARRCIRPAGSDWVRRRLGSVPLQEGATVSEVQLDHAGDRVQLALADGESCTIDHVLLGTGYRVDVSRYGFLPNELARQIATVAGYPRLDSGFQSSVPGLHFVGAPAAWTFGPVMRFVSGSWFTGRRLTAHVGYRPLRRIRVNGVRRLRTADESSGAL